MVAFEFTVSYFFINQLLELSFNVELHVRNCKTILSLECLLFFGILNHLYDVLGQLVFVSLNQIQFVIRLSQLHPYDKVVIAKIICDFNALSLLSSLS